MQTAFDDVATPEAKHRIRQWVESVFDKLSPLAQSISVVTNAESVGKMVAAENPVGKEAILEGVDKVLSIHQQRLMESVMELSKDLKSFEVKADGPREYTADETADMFVSHLMGLANYWATQVEREKGESNKAFRQRTHQGLIHSVLSTIDGNSIDMPGFYLIPMGCKEDRDYLTSQGEDYWPIASDETRQEMATLDIAGDLRQRMNKWRKAYTDKGEN